jgi:AraC family transcriptional regulator
MTTRPQLSRGEFFGCRVAQRRIGGFLLSLTRYDDADELPWHTHDETFVTFVIDGTYRERLRCATLDCVPRSVVVHPAGVEHADRFASRRANCLNLHLDASWTQQSRFVRTALVQTAPAAAIGARVAREFRLADGLSSLVIEGLMLELFAEVERTRDEDRAPSWLRKVRDVVGSQYAEPPSLAELAGLAGVHPVHLARAFRRHYGRTVGELIRELRVEEAKRRIVAGVALSDVALDTGFSDQSHMVRTFRRLTGVTPAAFRRANRVP